MILTPEWEHSNVVFVNPRSFDFYATNKPHVRQVFHDMHVALEDQGATVKVLGQHHKPLDIWIRDWGFVGSPKKRFFNYNPPYAKGLYSSKALALARIFLLTAIGDPDLVGESTSAITLDGGNIVHNGKMAIITDAVFKENLRVPRNVVENEIRTFLELEDLLIIPSWEEDIISHADGVLRFVSTHQVVLNYPDYDKGYV